VLKKPVLSLTEGSAVPALSFGRQASGALPPFGGAHALTYTFRSATTVVPSETLQAMPRPGSTCLFECSLTLQRFA
jgi:hypothetical protein